MAERWVEGINLRCQRLNGYKLLTVFTRELGLLKLTGSKLGGRSEPFVHIRYSFEHKTNREIFNIKSSEFIGSYPKLYEDYDRLQLAWEGAGYLDSCCEQNFEGLEPIFDQFLLFLSTLNEQQANPKLIFLQFVWGLCGDLGYEPSPCLHGEPELCALNFLEGNSCRAFFDLLGGGLICPVCQAEPERHGAELSQGSLALYKSMHCSGTLEKHNPDALLTLLKKYLVNHSLRRAK